MKPVIALAFGFAAASIALGASATTLHFVYTSPGGVNGYASWDQLSAPVVLDYTPGSDTRVSVKNGTESIGGLSDTFSSVFFFPAPPSALDFATDGSEGVSDYGAQLYSSMESAPVFQKGVYALAYGTLEVMALPEPAAWTSMLLGIAALGGALRLRDRAHPLAA